MTLVEREIHALKQRLGRLESYIAAGLADRSGGRISLADLDALTELQHGISLVQHGQHDEALAVFDDIARRAPFPQGTSEVVLRSYAQARCSRGELLMRLGRWAEGWDDLSLFLNLNDPVAMQFQDRIWNGSQLDGRTLLLLGGGRGDDFQFCRVLPELTRFGGRIVVRVWEDALKLLSRSFPGIEFVAREEELPSFDVLHQLMSVGRFLNIARPEDVAADVLYLATDTAKEALWRARLAHLPGLRVGLCWQGSGGVTDYRSVPLESFGDLPGVSFVNLQKGEASSRPLNLPWISDWTNEIHDFDDTAALISALDLVISVDTSVAHLAGALGKPVWTLLPQPACWRWLLDREDSPFYPRMRLFRCKKSGDWSDVIACVRSDLAAVASRREAA
jgi:Glycosyltransferase family 9 (heptosyltransferase)